MLTLFWARKAKSGDLLATSPLGLCALGMCLTRVASMQTDIESHRGRWFAH
jgi:hypothetical protein